MTSSADQYGKCPECSALPHQPHADMCSRSIDEPRRAVVCMDSFAGRVEKPVEVIYETPQHYRIRAIERMKWAGPNTWLDVGETALAPKSAVRFT